MLVFILFVTFVRLDLPRWLPSLLLSFLSICCLNSNLYVSFRVNSLKGAYTTKALSLFLSSSKVQIRQWAQHIDN